MNTDMGRRRRAGIPVGLDEALHEAAEAALFSASRRKLSPVDCTSFELMRRHRLTEALALDDDFAREGFSLLPGFIPSSAG